MTPKKRDMATVNPSWFVATAKLAMKRGTAIIFAKTGEVYGIVPNKGGSVNVFYPADKEWADYVLSVFPNGAVFPAGCMFGGGGVGKALRAYANLRMPTDRDGAAWIDPVTKALHFKGACATVHSSAFEASDTPAPQSPSAVTEFRFECEETTKETVKRLVEFTARDENRPYLKRIFAYHNDRGAFLGSTDGKSAVLHEAGYVPEGFSVDPTVVAPSDIVGYNHETTDSAADIHTYRLTDGTTVVEKLAGVRPRDISALVHNIGANRKIPLIVSSALAILSDDIASLGLGSNDRYGGVVRFEHGRAAVLSNGQPIAEFEIETGLEARRSASYSFPIVRRFAAFGADVLITDDPSCVAYARTAGTGGTEMLASPICLAPPKTEQAKAQ